MIGRSVGVGVCVARKIGGSVAHHERGLQVWSRLRFDETGRLLSVMATMV